MTPRHPTTGLPRRMPTLALWNGSPSRTRTYNLAVNSRPLYRLSYRGAPDTRGLLLAAEPGLEPGLRDPKSLVLPLHHSAANRSICTLMKAGASRLPREHAKWCRRPGSNRHEGCPPTVFETVASTYSATSALERKTGFEPATPSLARRCSTAELLPPPDSAFSAAERPYYRQ